MEIDSLLYIEAAWPARCNNPRIAHIIAFGYTLPRSQSISDTKHQQTRQCSHTRWAGKRRASVPGLAIL